MLKRFFAGVLLVMAFSGCMKDEEEDFVCQYDPCEFKAPPSQITEVQDYLAANNITATQHCSGLFYIIEEEGIGGAPTACHGVHVTYEGRLTNGDVFDAGTINIGLYQVILGWANGLPLIKPGGRIRLFVPPALGYGSQSQPSIPANSILIFDVELHGVN